MDQASILGEQNTTALLFRDLVSIVAFFIATEWFSETLPIMSPLVAYILMIGAQHMFGNP